MQYAGLNQQQDTPLAATLQAIYSDDTTGYVLYNDEPPSSYCEECTSFTLAHAKGRPLMYDLSAEYKHTATYCCALLPR